MSSRLAARPSGVCSMNNRTPSGLLARVPAFSGVSMKPGPIALTRTPSLPSSTASARVNPSTRLLRGGIGRRARLADMNERLDRADIDDAALVRAKRAEKGVRDVEHAGEVDRNHILPVLDHRLRGARHAVAPRDAGIVDEDGDRSDRVG